MMKKMLSGVIFVLCFMIGGTVSFAGEDYGMTAVKADRDYEWSESYAMVGFDVFSGRPVAFSELEGEYFYVYGPEDLKVEFRQMKDGVPYKDVLPNEIPSGLQRLTWRGVFEGDESGNFNGNKILTRAEMAALLVRLLGAEGEPAEAMPYMDVPADSWYAPYISSLMKRGIVSEDTHFYPQRPVTRQELVTMEYRIAKELDSRLKERKAFDGSVKDFDMVAEYAREAYEWLNGSGYHISMITLKESFIDSSETEFGLSPRGNVTRQDAAAELDSFLNDFMRNNRPPIPTASAEQYGFTKEMPRMTGSTSTYPITMSVYWNMFLNYENHPSYPENHDKTIDSYKMLINDETDIILVPDPNSEVRELTEEKGVKLEYIPIANEGLVFFTSRENSADNLNSADVEKIYAKNSVKNWNEIGGPDAPMAPFCRNNDSGSHAQMERFFLKGREIHPDIRRERTSIAMASIVTDVDEYNRKHPGSYAVGYSMYYYYQMSGQLLGTENLKLLSVDGVMPSEESLRNGSYPLTTNYFAVIRADEPKNSPARKMAKYLTGVTGQQIIENAGFGAL